MSYPQWWLELAEVASSDHDKWSAAWYRSMHDQYVARFPEADARSIENMQSFVAHAESREAAS